MMIRRTQNSLAKRPAKSKKSKILLKKACADDFAAVAKRLGCDEDKAAFDKKLGKIAKPKLI